MIPRCVLRRMGIRWLKQAAPCIPGRYLCAPKIFQERSLLQSGTGLQGDSKPREGTITMGHRPNDHEDPELTQSGMVSMIGH